MLFRQNTYVLKTQMILKLESQVHVNRAASGGIVWSCLKTCERLSPQIRVNSATVCVAWKER